MRGFRFRFYPTLKQRRYLARAFGTARHVFNWGLGTKRDAYAQHKECIGFVQLSRMLTASRTEKPWLAKVDRQIQTQALRGCWPSINPLQWTPRSLTRLRRLWCASSAPRP